MKVALVQMRSVSGDIDKNIQNHLKLAKKAIAEQAEVIIFPELSITAYEPRLAKKLACQPDEARFAVFQELADQHQVMLGIGMPTSSTKDVKISTAFFMPMQQPIVYSKQLLHDDELPYFVSGETLPPYLTFKGKRIGFGICYETLQRSHFTKAAAHASELFIASVAKPERGNNQAYVHFPSMAKEFNMPILMANCVGFCDDFMSNGKSAAWNRKGELIVQLDETNEGLLIYDIITEKVDNLQPI